MFRGSELPKLMSMVVLMGLLAMLMFRTRDPATWQWFVQDREPKDKAGPVAVAERAGPANSPASKTVAAVAIDEDPDQKAEAAEEFQAVTDGTIGIQPEEMFAYWRLFHWVESQPFESLRHRALRNVSFNELMHVPRKYRGRLISMDLNVRRVLAYDDDINPLGLKRLYEIWGWTDDSKAWLYDVVTAHLPDDMPVGTEVFERVRFVGYFFKLQGYYEAGAKPRATPLRAPLLVGRLTRYPPVVEPQSTEADWWTPGLVIAASLLLGGAVLAQYVHYRRVARRQSTREQAGSEAVRGWLSSDNATSDETSLVVQEQEGVEHSTIEPRRF